MNRPILLDYVTNRTGTTRKFFIYDYGKDANVLKEDPSIVFIECGESECSLETETRVSRKADDGEYAIHELETKTEVYRERDDEDFFPIAELFSKTYADRERDDEDDYFLNK